MRKYLKYAVHKSLSDETQEYIELRRNKCKNTSVLSRKNWTIWSERVSTHLVRFYFTLYIYLLSLIFCYYYFILRLRAGMGGEQLITSENRCRVYNNMKVPCNALTGLLSEEFEFLTSVNRRSAKYSCRPLCKFLFCVVNILPLVDILPRIAAATLLVC